MSKKIVILTQAHDDMCERLKDEAGYTSASEIIRHGISKLYSVHFKDYLESKKVKSQEVLLKEKKKEEQAKKQYSDEICEALNGEVKDGVCHWKSYTKMNPNLVQTHANQSPLELLNRKYVERQFDPNKEEVEATLSKMNEKHEQKGENT